jgi:hypothetical protein
MNEEGGLEKVADDERQRHANDSISASSKARSSWRSA